MATDTLVVFTSVPDETLAESLAEALVTQRLAACVKTLPACQAVYRWENQIEHHSEIPLVIVAHRSRYSELERYILAAHPYDVPEILAVDCADGLPDYHHWVRNVSQAQP